MERSSGLRAADALLEEEEEEEEVRSLVGVSC